MITITKDRANGFRLSTQGLAPKRTSVEDALPDTGWLPSRAEAYLCLAARVHGFSRVHLDRLVFERKEWLEISTLGNRSFLVPADEAAAAIRAHSVAEREAAERAMTKGGVTTADMRDVQYLLIETLGDGPKTLAEIRARLAKSTEGEARLLEGPGVLSAALTRLRQDGIAVRTNLSGGLDRGTAVHALVEELIPGLDAPSMSPEEAMERLCVQYFRAHGPASAADFGWWAGAGRREAAAAFEATRDRLAEIGVEGVPYRLFLPPFRLEQLIAEEHQPVEVVSLVPFRDPWLSSHEGRVGRFVREEHLARICPGPALPAILVSGRVAGGWTLNGGAEDVELTWFRPPSDRIEERARALAREMASFARRAELSPEPLSVPVPTGTFDVYR